MGEDPFLLFVITVGNRFLYQQNFRDLVCRLTVNVRDVDTRRSEELH